MLRRTVQLLGWVALPLVYAWLCYNSVRVAWMIAVPHWWVTAFSSGFLSVFVWASLIRIAAIAVVALPVGLLLFFLYPRRHAVAALVIGAVAWLLSQFRIIVHLQYEDRFIRTTLFVDIVVMIAALTAFSVAAKRLPSNNRWRGP